MIIGGHPNSGRLWRVKGTNWTVHTDGFQYSGRGLVVDGIELSAQRPQPGVPFANGEKKDFAWLGGLVPGMSRQEVAKWLKGKSLKNAATNQGIEISAKGLCPLVQGQFTTWTANLHFKKERLSGLALAATE